MKIQFSMPSGTLNRCAWMAILALVAMRCEADITDAVSREVSIYAPAQLPVVATEQIDAISREVSFFAPSTLPVVSVEQKDAVSREVSFFVPIPITPSADVIITDASSREVSFLTPMEIPIVSVAITDAASPEVSFFLPPWTVAEAIRAIAIASGLKKSDAYDAVRLGMEPGPGLEMLDALRIFRKAMRLDPN